MSFAGLLGFVVICLIFADIVGCYSHTENTCPICFGPHDVSICPEYLKCLKNKS